MDIGSASFWISLGEIVLINLVLSGDNAVVIALAARGLPRHQQGKAVFLGSAAAVAMRIALTIVALEALRLPGLKLVGAALLLWIGIGLLLPEHEAEGPSGPGGSLAAAIRTILLADLAMSLDNVLAVAAAARGSELLLVLGLAIGIPLVALGSNLMLRLIERVPAIVTVGGALLGYVAGEMAVTDPLAVDWLAANAPWMHVVAPLAGAAVVVLVGRAWAARRERTRSDTAAATADEADFRIE